MNVGVRLCVLCACESVCEFVNVLCAVLCASVIACVLLLQCVCVSMRVRACVVCVCAQGDVCVWCECERMFGRERAACTGERFVV